ncbi:hypothetical protein [Oleidesulfovibrio alaskensis]|jgi:hypothetical protein
MREDTMSMPIGLLREFIMEDLRAKPGVRRNEEIAVYISTWLGTPVPWYSMIIGVLLHRRGYSVRFVWDDLYDPLQPTDIVHNEEIAEALLLLSSRGLRTDKLSKMKQIAPSEDYLKEALRLASLHSIWWHKTPVPAPELHTRRLQSLKVMIDNLPYILGYFSEVAPRRLLMPGGIFANSGLFLYACAQNGVIATTYDSGVSSISTGVNSVAAHLDDIPHVMCQLLDADNVIAYAREAGGAELQKRFSGVDKYHFQPVERNSGHVQKYDVIFPLNIENDSSALGKHVFFNDSLQWLTETIDFIFTETKAHIAVRQHPYEKRIPWRNDALIHTLKERYASTERIAIFDCNSQINTYDIIASASLILPFVSSIAVEAAIMGKTVIPVAPAFYAGFSFAQMPASKGSYFTSILKSLEVKTEVPPEAKDEAWLAYYLSQICGRIWTDFTPQPEDYARWEGRSLAQLESDMNVEAVLKCLGDGAYISMVQHERIQREGLASVYRCF